MLELLAKQKERESSQKTHCPLIYSSVAHFKEKEGKKKIHLGTFSIAICMNKSNQITITNKLMPLTTKAGTYSWKHHDYIHEKHINETVNKEGIILSAVCFGKFSSECKHS